MIDVDLGGEPPIVSAVSEESCESDEDGDEAAAAAVILPVDDDAINTNNNTQMENQQIHISSSGELIVNGIYEQHFLTNMDGLGSTLSPEYMYRNTSGPFFIGNLHHDVCLFKKEGYGDKFRWCLALVPRINNLDTRDDDTIICQGQWDFARAYIYYWIEVSCFDEDDLALFRNAWSACHGARPVPCVKEVEQKDGGWWSKWQSIWN